MSSRLEEPPPPPLGPPRLFASRLAAAFSRILSRFLAARSLALSRTCCLRSRSFSRRYWATAFFFSRNCRARARCSSSFSRRLCRRMSSRSLRLVTGNNNSTLELEPISISDGPCPDASNTSTGFVVVVQVQTITQWSDSDMYLQSVVLYTRNMHTTSLIYLHFSIFWGLVPEKLIRFSFCFGDAIYHWIQSKLHSEEAVEKLWCTGSLMNAQEFSKKYHYLPDNGLNSSGFSSGSDTNAIGRAYASSTAFTPFSNSTSTCAPAPC